MDCTTPDIIIAPEYLKSDPESQTPIVNDNLVEDMNSSPRTNFDLDSDYEFKCEKSSGYTLFDASFKPLKNFISSPSPLSFLMI